MPDPTLDSCNGNEDDIMPATNRALAAMVYATVDTYSLSAGAVPLALSLCEATGGALTGYFLSLDANAPPASESRSLSAVRAEFDARTAANQKNASSFIDLAGAKGVRARTLTELDHSRGVIGSLGDQAHLHDLVVVGTDSGGKLSDRLIAENLLFEAGRPMLIAPAAWTATFACNRIAVAWDNSPCAARALGDALALLPGIGEVVFLMVGGEKTIQSSLDDKDIVRAMEHRGLAASVHRRELSGRSIASAIQDEAASLGADLLVMGAYGHSRLRDFILGGATLGVMQGPRMAVLMSH